VGDVVPARACADVADGTRWSFCAAGIIATYDDELIPSRCLETAIDNFLLQQLRWGHPGCRSLTTMPPNR
jgi:hypothetical protein